MITNITECAGIYLPEGSGWTMLVTHDEFHRFETLMCLCLLILMGAAVYAMYAIWRLANAVDEIQDSLDDERLGEELDGKI